MTMTFRALGHEQPIPSLITWGLQPQDDHDQAWHADDQPRSGVIKHGLNPCVAALSFVAQMIRRDQAPSIFAHTLIKWRDQPPDRPSCRSAHARGRVEHQGNQSPRPFAFWPKKYSCVPS